MTIFLISDRERELEKIVARSIQAINDLERKVFELTQQLASIPHEESDYFITPTHFEICDDDKQVIARVVMFEGGHVATVDVITLVDANSWTDVSDAIKLALLQMQLGDDT